MTPVEIPPKKDQHLRWAIMDRYLLRALWSPFLLGVGVFLAIGLTVGPGFDLVRQISRAGLAIAPALKSWGLQIPSFLGLALPMSMLLACLLAYSRLSRTSELITLRSCGVSVYRLALPAVLFSLVVAATTLGLNEFIVPTANYQARLTLDQALNRQHPAFQDQDIVYQEFDHHLLSYLFYARQFDGQWMRHVTILSFVQGRLDQILVTEAAQWNPTIKAWDLLTGRVYRLAAANRSPYASISPFQHQQLPLSRTPLDLAAETRQPDQMNIVDMHRFLHVLNSSGDQRRIREWQVRLQTKAAFPSICVVFALIGCGLGIQNRQQATSQGFGLSLLIIFGFYTVAFITLSLGKAGTLTAVTAAWSPPLLGGLLGSWLLWRANH